MLVFKNTNKYMLFEYYMLTFRQFFLAESPDFASFTAGGLQYNFKVGGKNTSDEVCFTVLKDGECISTKDITQKDLQAATSFIDHIITTNVSSKKIQFKKTIYTHLELRAVYIVKKFSVKNLEEFYKKWDELLQNIEFEGRAWQKNDTWFVSIHGHRQTKNFIQVFEILDTFDFYLETRSGTRYINKESTLPTTTPLRQKSPQLQKRIEQLRQRLHLATGNEKKAIVSLLDYFDR
jgi:hypothetical protein